MSRGPRGLGVAPSGKVDSGTARESDASKLEWRHERRRPERTLRYQLFAEHYPRFVELSADQGCALPHHVQRQLLLKILALGNQQIEAGEVQPAKDVIKRIRSNRAKS